VATFSAVAVLLPPGGVGPLGFLLVFVEVLAASATEAATSRARRGVFIMWILHRGVGRVSTTVRPEDEENRSQQAVKTHK
jgi:apolipoprotein N-acyltransferase